MKYLVLLVCFFLSSVCLSADLTYDEAIKLADKTDKKVFLYFGAEWCGYCGKMKQVFGDDEVAKKLDDHIIIFVDIDKNPQLKKKLSVKTIPDYMLIDGKEDILKRNKGYMNKDLFIKWLED
jgi:thioredoxin-related protein